jgi:hypothetical protein
MTKYALLGVALLAMTLVSHVHAQPVIEDPGYCAEFYPNSNCRNLGPGNPYADGGYFGSPPNSFMKRSACSSFPKRKT